MGTVLSCSRWLLFAAVELLLSITASFMACGCGCSFHPSLHPLWPVGVVEADDFMALSPCTCDILLLAEEDIPD